MTAYSPLSNLKFMEVLFTPEQEAQLSEIAHHEGTDPVQLVKNATLHLLEEDRRHREIIHQRIAQADRGKFLEEEEMDARFQKMMRP